jgi:hypothetical protein
MDVYTAEERSNRTDRCQKIERHVRAAVKLHAVADFKSALQLEGSVA